MKDKIIKLLTLFWTFFKIGLFTFGGGYAMIPLIQNEVSVKHKWLRAEEVSEVIAISESTPGPLSINAATYVGYRLMGVVGSIFATVGLIIPSFVIIYVISLFLDQFLQITIIANALMGIKAGVALLVLLGAYGLFKTMKKDAFSIIILSLIFIASIILCFVNVSFSSIYYIIGGGIIGIIFQLLHKERAGDNK